MQNSTFFIPKIQFLPLEFCCSIVKIMLIWNLYDEKMFSVWREEQIECHFRDSQTFSHPTLSLVFEPSVIFPPFVFSSSSFELTLAWEKFAANDNDNDIIMAKAWKSLDLVG